ATAATEQAREGERAAAAVREDAARVAANLAREIAESERQAASLKDRLERGERRLAEIDAAHTDGELARVKQEEALSSAREALHGLEGQQEGAREARVRWQVLEAQVSARLEAAAERVARAERTAAEAETQAGALGAEIAQLALDADAVEAHRAQWLEQRAERRVAVLELEAAATDVEATAAAAEQELAEADAAQAAGRTAVESMTEEHHRMEVDATDLIARRRAIVERIEADWRKPLDALLADAVLLDLDLETLEAENARIVDALEGIGPVNALAVEEYGEEAKRLEFLTAQRDDLVAGRLSLQQAIREIDGTAKAMFVETFEAVRENFKRVFQTLFGGGECELRLASPDEPLESEIDIHAAPRGKRTQRIHLLSSGERTLVATSLLFSIYLTKPSPFCLMDEVDAPLDDANVGRFTRLLEEFKSATQFIVITHNPRTMQSADAVYGVTMQEPGVSTIVGVRLGETAGA
ncbi:MAG TPA: AAA family ATPase, partial [Gemmatimonadales bacterium]|nr:AAA family ATPase [Gemmatimonadales bacterium]